MKRILIIAACLAGVFFIAFTALSQTSPGWFFDLKQKIKYPDYYSWRSGKSDFPTEQFWIGFNTDRHKQEIFLGRTRQSIQERLPLVIPIPEDDTLLLGYIGSKQLPPERFAMIRGSMWILEFDEADRCIDITMPKG